MIFDINVPYQLSNHFIVHTKGIVNLDNPQFGNLTYKKRILKTARNAMYPRMVAEAIINFWSFLGKLKCLIAFLYKYITLESIKKR